MTKNYLYFDSSIGTVFNTQLKIIEIYTIPFKIFLSLKELIRFFGQIKNIIPKRNCYNFSVCGIIQLFENI